MDGGGPLQPPVHEPLSLGFLCGRLDRSFDRHALTRGAASLDAWLRDHALDSDGRNLTRTWVWHRGEKVILAHYALAPYFIERDSLSSRQGRGLPDRIPCYLLARLALDRSLQGKGLGSQLLGSALLRVASGAAQLAGRFVIVDAADESAAGFYRHHSFDPIPDVSGRFILPIKRIPSPSH